MKTHLGLVLVFIAASGDSLATGCTDASEAQSEHSGERAPIAYQLLGARHANTRIEELENLVISLPNQGAFEISGRIEVRVASMDTFSSQHSVSIHDRTGNGLKYEKFVRKPGRSSDGRSFEEESLEGVEFEMHMGHTIVIYIPQLDQQIWVTSVRFARNSMEAETVRFAIQSHESVEVAKIR